MTNQPTTLDAITIFGSAALMLLLVLGIILLIQTLTVPKETRAAQKKAFDLIQEALRKGRYDLIHKCLWIHPEGAGEINIKVLIHLSNNTSIYFDTFNSVGDSIYRVGGERGKILNEIRTRKTSTMIIDFFWDQQTQEQENKHNEDTLERQKILSQF